jgi:hypothetical protein
MKKIVSIVSLLMLAAVILTSAASGQSAASVTWNLILPDSLIVTTMVGNVYGSTAAGTDSFIVRSYTGTMGGSPGPLGNYCRWNPGASYNWGPEIQENAYHYVQFVAAPKTGASFTIDSASIWLGGGGTSAMRAFVYYSKDASFATKVRLTPVGGTTGDTLILGNSGSASNTVYAFAVKTTVTSGQSLYVRVYPWYTGAASTSKYLLTQLMIIKGSTAGGTGVAQTGNGIPSTFALDQNYPNPFNPTTQISYSIPKESNVTLKVFNLMGQEVATLVSGFQSAGTYAVPFHASHLSSGVYLYRVQAGTSFDVKRMLLVK